MQFSNINYNLYKSFLVVYETSNISKAAELLYISQPAVSHNIKELEKQLGVQLFYKRANGMSSTTEADTLYRYISSAFNSIWKGEMTISDMAGLKTGVVKIGTQSYLSVLFLSNIITEFRQKFPNIKIEINCKASTELLAGLQTQNIDVVIENQPINIEKISIKAQPDKKDKNNFIATIDAQNFKASMKNPAFAISAPACKINADSKTLNLEPFTIDAQGTKIAAAGKIENYMTKPQISFATSGNIAPQTVLAFVPAQNKKYVTYQGQMPFSAKIDGGLDDKHQRG